jgi:hypothetical protein
MKKRKLAMFGIAALTLLSGAGEVVAQTICGWWQWFVPGLWGVCITDAFLRWFFGACIRLFLWSIKGLILLNPDPASVAPLMNAYMDLMQPVFLLSILVIGFYLIFMSGSPGGRSKAKSMFWKLLLTMILVSLSLEIFKILLAISQGLTMKVLAGVEYDSLDFSVIENITFLFVQLLLLPVFTFTLMSIGIRYILVLVTAALFPITIFLYLFELPIIGVMGKEIGAKLWRWTIGVIFAQVVQAIMLAVTVISFTNISEVPGYGNIGAVFMGMAGFLMIAFAPLMMMQVLAWIGAVFLSAGVAVSFVNPALGFAMTAMGGLMMGQGPASSLMAGGGAAGMAFAMGMGKTSAAAATRKPKKRKRK